MKKLYAIALSVLSSCVMAQDTSLTEYTNNFDVYGSQPQTSNIQNYDAGISMKREADDTGADNALLNLLGSGCSTNFDLFNAAEGFFGKNGVTKEQIDSVELDDYDMKMIEAIMQDDKLIAAAMSNHMKSHPNAKLFGAGILTFDGANLAKMIADMLRTIKMFKQSFGCAKNQFKADVMSLKSLIQGAKLGDFGRDMLIEYALPREWGEVYDEYRSMGRGALNPHWGNERDNIIKRLLDDVVITNHCQDIQDYSRRVACENLQMDAPRRMAAGKVAFEQMVKMDANLDLIEGRANQTKGTKEIAELQVRATTENARVTNELTRIILQQQMDAAHSEMELSKKAQYEAKLLNNTLTPVPSEIKITWKEKRK